MYRRVLVGYNGTDQARDGLELARLLARPTGAELLVACVFTHHYPYLLTYDYELERQAAESVLSEAVEALGEDAAGARTRAFAAASAAAGLHDLAKTGSVDLVVLGSGHRGAVGRVLAGSVAERLLHGSPCAVAVAPRGFREGEHRAPQSIAVGFDGLPESQAALAAAIDLARTLKASIRLLAVHQPVFVTGYGELPPAYDRDELVREGKENLERAMKKALEGVPPDVSAQGKVLEGDPAEVLAAETVAGVDLLVAGSRGYGPVGSVLLGSVAAQLVRSAHCPVLVLPRSAAASQIPEA